MNTQPTPTQTVDQMIKDNHKILAAYKAAKIKIWRQTNKLRKERERKMNRAKWNLS